MTVTPVDLSRVRVLGGPLRQAQDLNRTYLLELEPDRLLAHFREESGLPSKASHYEGWEAQGVSGHTLGHYLSACAMMVAATGEDAFKNRVSYVVDQLQECQDSNGDGYVAAIPGGKALFAEIAAGNIRSQGFDLNGGWVPLYTLHKLFAGLRDAYRWANSSDALLVETRLGEWLAVTVSSLTGDQLQTVMDCEFGGISEVLADLSVDSNTPAFLALSQRFHHAAILDPLADGIDDLDGKHANTQIPKVVGAARQYELTKNPMYRRIADFFWSEVTGRHSYAIGGNSFNEHFGGPGCLNDRLGASTCETCNSYNMLKLTRYLFCWQPSAVYADFYERTLYNHILGSQHTTDGRVSYFVSLEMGGRKEFQPKFDRFSCCVGSGMENHAGYGAGIYYTDVRTLYVAQYVPSQLDWPEQGVTITQVTDFPTQDTVTFKFSLQSPTELELKLRQPHWANSGMWLHVNDEVAVKREEPASFVSINRVWQDGDALTVRMPMSVQLEAMPDNENRVCLTYGPLVLAGDLDGEDVASQQQRPPTPVLISERAEVLNRIQPDPVRPLTFQLMDGLGYLRGAALRPFYTINDQRYTVYWDLFTPQQWQREKMRYLAESDQLQLLDSRTIDQLQTGEMQPERDHAFAGEDSRAGTHAGRAYRDTWLDGWFSYRLAILPDQPVDLVITYAQTDEGINRYHVTVDGSPLNEGDDETTRHPFSRSSYQLPPELTWGKEQVEVRFTAHPGCKVGPICGIRTVRRPTSA